GASGFLLKDTSSEELGAAIRAVHAGDAVLAPRVTSTLVKFVVRTPAADGHGALAGLTPREREVLRRIVEGASNEDIATTLFMTGNTVKTHIKSILSKLALPDRVHVVIWAYERGLVDAI
ncbi:MAG TPA: response regulator transcription factor, partial [Naasia sp.]